MMNRTLSFSLVFLGLCASACLCGCGVDNIRIDTAGESEAAVVSPALSGSNYGGHAPIVGAQVYVLTPSQTANAGLSKSIMCGDSPSTACTPTGTGNGLVTPGGSYGYHYVTTDYSGFFSLSGDYNCSVDQAVYLAAVGGTPRYNTSSSTFQTSQIVVSNVSGTGSSQTATYTFTTMTTELFYVGELVTLTGYTGNFAYMNNTVQQVLSTNLSTTTFAATIGTYNGTTNIAANTYTTVGTVTAQPTSNPGIVNMAYLGLCPSSGTFSGTVGFVYMNEISTTALAYAAAAFGSDGFHIGVNYNPNSALNTANPSYVLNGLKQALQNATNLYDISGGNVGTANAGEGHIARQYTPGGNGTVPQTTIDTIGNILAACVDSQNTYGPANTGGTKSPQCYGTTGLFMMATSDGTSSGTQPTDIATAAFNMAHYPAGVGNTSFVSNLYDLPTGNVPFAPNLSKQPNDFSISIAYTAPSSTTNSVNGGTNSLFNAPQVISIDAGNYVGTESGYSGASGGEVQEGVWVGNYYTQAVKIFASTGIADYTTNANLSGTANVRSVAEDSSDNVWMTQQDADNILKISNTGATLGTYTATNAGGMNNPIAASIDASGNVYISNWQNYNLLKLNSAGQNVKNVNTVSNTVWSNSGCAGDTQVNTIDQNGVIYSLNLGSSQICSLNPSTGAVYNTASGPTTGGPNYISVDGNNVVWGVKNTTPYQLLGYINGNTTISKTYTGGGLNVPCSTAVDGAGTIWVGNGGNSSVSAFNSSGTALSPAANTTSGNTAVTTGGYNPQNLASNCASPAIDRAGNVWMAYQGGVLGPTTIIEIVGIAAPVVTPVSYATANSLLGTRPY